MKYRYCVFGFLFFIPYLFSMGSNTDYLYALSQNKIPLNEQVYVCVDNKIKKGKVIGVDFSPGEEEFYHVELDAKKVLLMPLSRIYTRYYKPQDICTNDQVYIYCNNTFVQARVKDVITKKMHNDTVKKFNLEWKNSINNLVSSFILKERIYKKG